MIQLMNPSEGKPSGDDRKTDSGGFGDNPWRAAGLVGSVGVNLGACLGLGYWLGAKFDSAQDTEHWSIIGMAAGLAVGIMMTIFLIRTFTGGKRN